MQKRTSLVLKNAISPLDFGHYFFRYKFFLAGREVGNQELTVMMMKTESIGKRACPKGANKSCRGRAYLFTYLYHGTYGAGIF
jgi:hypothetical protein